YINIISGVFGFGAIVFFLLIDSAFTNTTMVNLETVEYLNKTGHYIILITTGIIYILIAITCFLGIRENPTERDNKPTTVNAGSEKVTSSRPGRWYKEIAHSFKFSELKKEWEFFKMLIATLVFNIGSKMFLPWIFEFVTALPLDFLVIGVVLLEYIFLGFGMSVLLGKLCDKYGRKKPLIYSILIGCGGFFMVPVVVTTMNIALLIISIGLMLFILNGVVTILGAWTQDLLPDEKRGQFIGINNMSNTVNQMIGVWIGGAIYGAIDQPAIAISWQVFFASFLFLASIPIFMRVKETVVLDGTPMKITTVGSSQGSEENQS
ncbi:MFS transporter, partial [Candidatus Bathyarchaeota archaeon]|nr:MFS transporter [Candidatus Bathyarchaeota archaeon]